MGYPLWGQDLDEDTTPLEAGLGWAVDWNHEFVGHEALAEQRAGNLRKRMVGFRMRDRRPPRNGYRLRSGESTGAVASGNFSPVLGVGIGLGYLSPPLKDDAELEIEVRGQWQAVERAGLPFIGD